MEVVGVSSALRVPVSSSFTSSVWAHFVQTSFFLGSLFVILSNRGDVFIKQLVKLALNQYFLFSLPTIKHKLNTNQPWWPFYGTHTANEINTTVHTPMSLCKSLTSENIILNGNTWEPVGATHFPLPHSLSYVESAGVRRNVVAF